MKTFYSFLVVLAVLLVTGGIAKADPIDFRMNVLDPNISRVDISSQPFTVTFGTCDYSILPPGVNPLPVGCFYGRNTSGAAWTALDLVFPNSGGIAGQIANCTPQPAGNIFTSAQCTTTSTAFDLIFKGGNGIPNNGEFVITEFGAPITGPDAFPDGALDFTAVPEPGSMLLLSTGLVVFGVFLVRQRKFGFGRVGV